MGALISDINEINRNGGGTIVPNYQEVEAPKAAEVTIQEIPLDRIVTNPYQPRTTFDQEALAELAESIRLLGLIQPITVREVGLKYQIISGERRWRASQRVGLATMPAYVREVDDENLHAMALVENIQRQDLNAIEIALGMQRLIDECGLTQEAMAEKVGKKRSTVSNYMRLLSLPSEVQLALKEGIISMGHAKAIAGLNAEDQIKALKKCIKKSLSVRQMELLARKLNEAPKQNTSNEDEEYPETYSHLVDELERVFSENISIKRTKTGSCRITIECANDQEIDKLISRLASVK